jgi:hypothetical protein
MIGNPCYEATAYTSSAYNEEVYVMEVPTTKQCIKFHISPLNKEVPTPLRSSILSAKLSCEPR